MLVRSEKITPEVGGSDTTSGITIRNQKGKGISFLLDFLVVDQAVDGSF